MNSLVSVVIATYNYASFVKEAIESCLKQTYSHIEIIVVDDGSSDDTQTVLTTEFSETIIPVFQDNQGVSAARNTGLRQAKGEFITFLDADDYFTEDSVEVRLNILLKHRDIDIVVS